MTANEATDISSSSIHNAKPLDITADILSQLEVAKSADTEIKEIQCVRKLLKIIKYEESKYNKIDLTIDKQKHIPLSEILSILINWLQHAANHSDTQRHILRLLSSLIVILPIKSIKPNMMLNCIDLIMTNLWYTLSEDEAVYATDLLLSLWLKTRFDLNMYASLIVDAMRHSEESAVYSAYGFLARCALYPSRKQEIVEFMKYPCLSIPSIVENGTYDHGLSVGTLMYILSTVLNMETLRKTSNYGTTNINELLSYTDGHECRGNALKLMDKYGGLYDYDGNTDIDYNNYNVALLQIHVWNHKRASWIQYQCDMKIDDNKLVKSKNNKSGLVKKYGGLDDNEILMYQAIMSVVNNEYEMDIPHELLMLFLIYSQGYKYENGEKVIYFPSGLFSDSQHGQIMEVVENKKDDTFQYRIKVKKGGSSHRVPFNHVFANSLLIINEQLLYNKYSSMKTQFKNGDVVFVQKMKPIEVEIYSKKKKRNIRKLQLEMKIYNLWDKSRGIPKKKYYSKQKFTVVYDSNIFLSAKFKKINT